MIINGAHQPNQTRKISSPRAERRLRTQRKLLFAAREMMAQGEPVTVPLVAGRAGVSVATAYRYYSDAETLRTDAALEHGMAPDGDIVTEFERVAEGVTDPRERLLIGQRHMLAFVIERHADYRLFIAKLHEQMLSDNGRGQALSRGGRRQLIIAAALESLEEAFGPERWRDLIHALMLVTGAEPYYILTDFAGLSPQQIMKVNEQAVLDVLDAHLARAGLSC